MNFVTIRKGQVRVGIITLLIGLFVAPLTFGQGRIPTPLYIMPEFGVTDMNGNLVAGNTFSPGGLVQVLSAADGIQPPDPDTGQPSPLNPLLPNGETFIGRNISPALDQSGLFSASLAGPRPAPNQAFFVRVYSDSSIGSAIFYADSEVMTVPNDAATLMYVSMGQLTNIVSLTRDTSINGLPDWWEQRYFGSINAVGDPDALLPGHRMTAREAYIAGTNPLDPDSVFFITAVAPHFADDYTEFVWTDPDDSSNTTTTKVYEVVGHILSWPSVPERLYTIEYTTNILTGFTMIAENVAADVSGVNTYTVPLTPAEAMIPRFYRARVTWPGAIPRP